MYILKQVPEDFVVKEITNLKFKETGRFIYFRLKKRNLNTLDAVRKIVQALHIKEKHLGFAGSKDKNALTEQICSVFGVSKEKLLSLKFDNFEIEFLGYGTDPISLGDLAGNSFEIVIRNLTLAETELKPLHFVTNYFDEQRFSTHNKEIGKYLIKKEFKHAVQLIDDLRSQRHLEQSPHDYVGALSKLPKKLLKMYVHAYQSYLWNTTVAEYLRKNFTVLKEVQYSLGQLVFVEKMDPTLKIPLIGFASEELESSEISKIISDLMLKEEIDYADFVIKAIPDLSSEGELRDVFIPVQQLEIGKIVEDDLNPGKKKITVSFSLGKGSYATMVIKKLIG